MPERFQLTLDWTLALCVRLPSPSWQTKPQFHHVHDLDAKLVIAYWYEGDGIFGWELDEAEIDGVTVTHKTDPDFWKVINRAVDYHEGSINEQVQERAHERSAA